MGILTRCIWETPKRVLLQTVFENYVTPHSKFPPEMWAEIPSNNKRTNNTAESFHAHFHTQFYTVHPTIFIFLDVLVKLQATTLRKSFNQANNNGNINPLYLGNP